MTNSRTNTSEISVYGPYVTLLAGLFAVTFDVGFFWGINIGYFTFFNLSEHLVFALQALPLAFLIVLFLIVGYASATQEATNREPSKFIGNSKTQRFERAFIFVLFLLTISNVFLAQWNAAVIVGFSLIFGSVDYFLRNSKSFSDTTRMQIAPAMLLLSLTCLVFFLGIISPSILTWLKDKDTVYFYDGNEIHGVVIRAGDRGILIADSKNSRASFQKWDAIKKVDSLLEKTTPKK